MNAGIRKLKLFMVSMVLTALFVVSVLPLNVTLAAADAQLEPSAEAGLVPDSNKAERPAVPERIRDSEDLLPLLTGQLQPETHAAKVSEKQPEPRFSKVPDDVMAQVLAQPKRKVPAVTQDVYSAVPAELLNRIIRERGPVSSFTPGRLPLPGTKEAPGYGAVTGQVYGSFVQMPSQRQPQREQTEKRTRNSRTFLNSDGTTTVQSSTYSLNYFDGQAWQPVDTTIREDRSSKALRSAAGSRSFTHSMLTNAFKVRLNNQGREQAVSFAVYDQSVTYRGVGMNNVTGIVYGDTITYPEAWAFTDLVYQVQNDQLKMELHLKDQQAPKVFVFELEQENVDYRLNADGTVDFLDKAGNISFKIPQLWLIDASGEERKYNPLKLDISKEKEKIMLKISLDDAGLQYPLTIDPSTSLTYSQTLTSTVSYYDAANRLMADRLPGGDVQEYQYDANGNLLKKRRTNNLIINADFEYVTGWDIQNPNMSFQSNIVKEGSRALHFWSASPVTVTADSMRIPVQAGTEYTLSGWVSNSLTNNGLMLIDWQEFDAAGNIVVDGGGFWPTRKNQWEYGTSVFTTHPAAVTLRVRVIAYMAQGDGFADGIRLTKGRVDELPGGTFEPGEAKWAMDPLMSLQTGIVKEGTRALKFWSASPVTVTADSGQIQVEPGTEYKLSGWVSNSLTNNGLMLVDWQEFDAAGNIVVDGGGFWPSVKNQWEYGTSVFTTHPATVTLRVRVIAYTAQGDGFADGIRLVKNTTAQSPNLLVNPDFTYTGTNGVADNWNKVSPPSGQFTVVPLGNGISAQRIAATNIPYGYGVMITQNATVTAGMSYKYSARVKPESVNAAQIVHYLVFYDAQGQVLAGQNRVATERAETGEHDTMIVTGVVPAGATGIEVRIYLLGLSTADTASGSFLVHSPSLEYTASRVYNGGFDRVIDTASGVADGWVKSGPPSVGTYSINQNAGGNKTQRIAASGIGYGWGVQVVQNVPVSAGASYTYSAQIKAESLNNSVVAHYLVFYDAQGVEISGQSRFLSQAEVTGGFVPKTITGVIPAGAVTMQMRIYLLGLDTGNNASGAFQVDDVSLYQS